MKYSDDDFLSFDQFQGTDGDLALHTKKLVVARKEHACVGFDGSPPHQIQTGERHLHERALVDSDFWGNYRVCLPCLTRMMIEADYAEDDDEDR